MTKKEHLWVGKLVNVLILGRESLKRFISNTPCTTATTPLWLSEPPSLVETRQLCAHKEKVG